MRGMEKMHITVSIFAALVVTAVCIAMRASLYQMAVWVSVSIVIFYLIGQTMRIFLTYKVFPQNDVPEAANGVSGLDDVSGSESNENTMI